MSTLRHEIERAVRLVHAIGLAVGDRYFVAADVIGHADANLALRTALLLDLGELNGRKLGRFLRYVEGANLDGITVRRIGADRDGLVWRFCEFQRIETHLQSDIS